MSENTDGELSIDTISLHSDHLSHAIELMRLSKTPAKIASALTVLVLSRRLAVSSIIHSFSGLESLVNYFGFELFFNADSQRFVPPNKRDFLLSRMVKSWDKVPCIDKLSVVLAHSGKVALSSRLENQLRELNNLRNWLVHGVSYKTTSLWEPVSGKPGTHQLVDREDSVDWAKKFPNTKFKPLDRLNAIDAYTALQIVFEAGKLLYDSMPETLHIYTCIPKFKFVDLDEDSFNAKVEELLSE